MKFFLGLLAIIFIKPIIGIVKFLWMIISFAVQLLFYKIVFKILDWLFKLLLTVFTLSLGFQGGEVTPLFAIGASLGAVLAPILGLPISLVAGLGYLSVFGSSTNTLLAPIFIGIEIFGPANAIPYAIVMAFAYIINHKTSIYGQQKMLEMQ